MPYVNRWGAEDTATLSIEPDPSIGGALGLFIPDVGDEPDFTKQSPQRQRECVALGLCQVCRRFVPWSRRLLVISTISVSRIDYKGRAMDVVTEPWLDERCARFAIEKCPALIRRKSADDLSLVHVSSKRQVTLVKSHGWVEGPMEAYSREVMPAMWCKVLLGAADGGPGHG